MARVEYDPEELTFTIHRPESRVSGCEVETWTYYPDEDEFVVATCIDGELYTAAATIEKAVETLRDAAAEAGLQAQLLLAALEPSLLDEYFLDIRYVIDSRGELVAVELLPCMGSPGCGWIRVEGETRTEKIFLDSIEGLVPCRRT